MCSVCGCGHPDPRRKAIAGRIQLPGHGAVIAADQILEIEEDILARNDVIAAQNRARLATLHILALNLVSSPGSGKTTLLVETLKRLQADYPVAVIEGDQQTELDAERIRATGAPALQINTGHGCHLDAQQIARALDQLALPENGFLFIENVGNLVCPAGFDLGETANVAILSVTEGEDKPLKYPDLFAAAEVLIINKIDLLPYVPFRLDQAIAHARSIQPQVQIYCVCALSGAGMDDWINWLKRA